MGGGWAGKRKRQKQESKRRFAVTLTWQLPAGTEKQWGPCGSDLGHFACQWALETLATGRAPHLRPAGRQKICLYSLLSVSLSSPSTSEKPPSLEGEDALRAWAQAACYLCLMMSLFYL